MNESAQAWFWLICAAFWLVVPRLPFALIQGRHGEALRPFLNPLGYLIAVLSVAMWLLQRSTEPGTAVFPADWPSPQRWIALAIMVAGWGTILWWTFVRGGARRIAEATAKDVRFVHALIVLVIGASAASTVMQYVAGDAIGGLVR